MLNTALPACLQPSRLPCLPAAGGGGAFSQSSSPFTGLDSFGVSIGSDGGGAGLGAGDSGADGTSGEGKPFPFAAITLTDAKGNAVTAKTDATGYYRAKITGFISPMVVSATLGAKTYYSFTTAVPKPNGFITINVTGLTDKLASDIAVKAGKTSASALTPAILTADTSAVVVALNNLRTALATQLVANGLSKDSFDPITMPFKTDGKGYDAVLDTTLVTKTGSGATQITPNGQTPAPGQDTSGIAVFVNEINRLNTAAGRQGAAFAELIDGGYIDGTDNKTILLSRLRSETRSYTIVSPSFKKCVLADNTCEFYGTLTSNDPTYGSRSIVSSSVKFSSGVWRFYGSQDPLRGAISNSPSGGSSGAVAAPPTLPVFEVAQQATSDQYYSSFVRPQLTWSACVSTTSNDSGNVANNQAFGFMTVDGATSGPSNSPANGTCVYNVGSSGLTADLSVTIAVPTFGVGGQTVLATVTVSNLGPAVANNVTATIVAPSGGGQQIVIGTLAVGTTITATLSHVISTVVAGSPTIINSYIVRPPFLGGTKYKSAIVRYFGTSAAPQASPVLFMKLDTRATAPCAGNVVIDDASLPVCSSQISHTGSHAITAFNSDFATGSVTFQITLFELPSYAGTQTIVLQPFAQQLFTSADTALFPTVPNPADFQNGSVNFSSALSAVDFVSFGASKRTTSFALSAYSGPIAFWSTATTPSVSSLLGNVSLTKAEARCANCGNYSGTGNPQIRNLTIIGRDLSGRFIRSDFWYPYIY